MTNSPQTDIAIRRASPADGFFVEALTRRIWTGRVGPDSTVFRETPESVAAQIAKGGGALLLRGGEMIGSGRWVEVSGPGGQGCWMEVKRIGVLPSHTGQGLGAIILGVLEAQGREAGMAGAQLAVRFDQPRLVAYYTALGYQLAEDVALTTVNPRAPPPTGMRKWF